MDFGELTMMAPTTVLFMLLFRTGVQGVIHFLIERILVNFKPKKT